MCSSIHFCLPHSSQSVWARPWGRLSYVVCWIWWGSTHGQVDSGGWSHCLCDLGPYPGQESEKKPHWLYTIPWRETRVPTAYVYRLRYKTCAMYMYIPQLKHKLHNNLDSYGQNIGRILYGPTCREGKWKESHPSNQQLKFIRFLHTSHQLSLWREACTCRTGRVTSSL